MVSNNSAFGSDESIQETPIATEPAAVASSEHDPAIRPEQPAIPEPPATPAPDPVTAPSAASEPPSDVPGAEAAPPSATHEEPEAAPAHTEPEAAEAAEPAMGQDALEQQLSANGVRKGDILEGTILSTSAMEVVVDLGNSVEGVIQSKELEKMDKDSLEALKVGEKVLAFVVSPADPETKQVVLSLQRAQEEKNWREAERLLESGEIFGGKIDGFNKGGLIVRFGKVRGFVPESQVSRERRRRTEGMDPNNKWASMRGEEISVKVLEVDRSRNRLILSERDAAPKIREEQKARLLDELKVGDVRVGKIKSVADFGVFVDVGGADGLVHLTELSWKHIAKPSDVFTVGQEVKVEVINIDRDRRRIGLSIKRQEEDPWTTITKNYTVGQLVQGTITKLTKFGAFARLVDAPEIEGLIHISELADHRVTHPKDVVNEGDVLTLRVVKIDQDERRMGLSLKRVDSPDYLEGDYRRATRPAESMSEIADFEAAAFREEEKGRRERKKGTPGGKKSGKKGRDFEDEFENEF